LVALGKNPRVLCHWTTFPAQSQLLITYRFNILGDEMWIVHKALPILKHYLHEISTVWLFQLLAKLAVFSSNTNFSLGRMTELVS
jgi:hypothetical protein